MMLLIFFGCGERKILQIIKHNKNFRIEKKNSFCDKMINGRFKCKKIDYLIHDIKNITGETYVIFHKKI